MPIDTHIIMGLNDAIALAYLVPTDPALRPAAVQELTAQFMTRVGEWYNITIDHTNRHQLDTPDRFSVSKLLRPPQMYSLPGNEYWGWPTFNDLIDSINLAIVNFNQEVRSSQNEILGGIGQNPVVANISILGTRRPRRGRAQAWNEGREASYDRKLHLDHPRQAKALTMAVKYLQLHTPNAPNQYRNTENNNDNDENNNAESDP